jgi:hypothetical protein
LTLCSFLSEYGWANTWQIGKVADAGACKRGKAGIDVKVTTVEQFCAENGISHVDYIKVDVEGSEWVVLDGMRSFMAKPGSIDMASFEYAFNWESELYNKVGWQASIAPQHCGTDQTKWASEACLGKILDAIEAPETTAGGHNAKTLRRFTKMMKELGWSSYMLHTDRHGVLSLVPISGVWWSNWYDMCLHWEKLPHEAPFLKPIKGNGDKVHQWCWTDLVVLRDGSAAQQELMRITRGPSKPLPDCLGGSGSGGSGGGSGGGALRGSGFGSSAAPPVSAVSAAAPKSPWLEAKDPTTGKTYWYHSITRATSWVDPLAANPI